ncbi:MAG: L-asparaginase 1 [Bacteroidetes bacterium]|nr:MAG: L-asparaginase 1 [Bacteroidota bacterium]
MKDTSILLIYTGGTIGMVKDEETGSLKPFNLDKIINYIPELSHLNYNLEKVSFDPLIDSSDMSPKQWIELAEIIEKNYDDYDGFVILHGTDTMSYTASALSFILENLNKPVILTGSQLPLGVVRTDGRDNFITALEIASAKENGVPIVPEVCLYFENRLYRGNRTYKYNAENFNAFRSVNYPLLAESGIYIRYKRKNIHKPDNKKLIVHKKLSSQIGIMKIFPGMQPSFVEAMLNAKGIKALVLETFGSGNAFTNKWFIELLEKAINNGLMIFNVTQCIGGSVEMGKYETSRKLKKIGLVGAVDMTTSAAVTKLMVIMGEESDSDTIKSKFTESWAGEITE